MAADHQIDRAFQDLGSLFAAEHSEHDDDGARQIGRMIRLLRKFKSHEQTERRQMLGPMARVMEATYDGHGGSKVWYDAGDALRDAADLYAVTSENDQTGSPNLENMQAREILGRLQRGGGLGEVHVGTLRGLLTKHQGRISSYRQRRDRGSAPDMLAIASDGPNSRIIPATERT